MVPSMGDDGMVPSMGDDGMVPSAGDDGMVPSMGDDGVWFVAAVGPIVLAVSLALLYKFINRRKPKLLPPGPAGLPVIGNLLDFKGSTQVKTTLIWKERYGHVVWYRLGFYNWIVLNSIEALTEAYTQHASDFSSRPNIPSLVAFHKGMDMAMAPYNAGLVHRRKVALKILRQYLSSTDHTKTIDRMVKEAISLMMTEKGPFRLYPFFTFIILNVLHEMIFGCTLAIDDHNYMKVSSCLENRGEITGFWEDIFPILKYFPSKRFKDAEDDRRKLQAYVDQQIQKRRSVFDKNKLVTLIDHILLAKERVNDGDDETLKEGFTDQHVVKIIMQILSNGLLTSRLTLEWIFLFLATKQDVQDKIHQEIDRVVGKKSAGLEHRTALPYTEAVIMEVMRMYPVTPMGLPHETLCDTQVLGYHIPAKTRVTVNYYAIMSDPRHWQNPEKFVPERFMDEDGTKLRARSKSWIPFSIGLRNCIGEALARQNILYTVIGILQKARFDLEPGMEPHNLTPDDRWFDLKVKPYKVFITSRGH